MVKIKSIGIAGAGGIGAFFCDFLFNYCIQRNQYPDLHKAEVDLYDNDSVDATNFLHQNFTSSDLGMLKCQVVADRTGFKPISRFMTTEDFPKYDVIVSCVDGMAFRRDLYAYAAKTPKLFWIDGRCNSRNYGVFNAAVPMKECMEHIDVKDETRGGCLRAVDKTNKVSHVTPLIVAGTMVQIFLNHVRGESVQYPILTFV